MKTWSILTTLLFHTIMSQIFSRTFNEYYYENGLLTIISIKYPWKHYVNEEMKVKIKVTKSCMYLYTNYHFQIYMVIYISSYDFKVNYEWKKLI